MIVKFFYIAFFLLLAILLELLLLSFGLFFPFAAFFIFYAATAFGWKEALAAAFFASCGLDLAVGHQHFYSLIGFIPVILLSRFWLYKIRSESIFLHFIPGGLIPLFMWGGRVIFHWSNFHELPTRLALLLGSAVSGMIYLPLLILLLDTLNESMGMTLYTNQKLDLDREY